MSQTMPLAQNISPIPEEREENSAALLGPRIFQRIKRGSSQRKRRSPGIAPSPLCLQDSFRNPRRCHGSLVPLPKAKPPGMHVKVGNFPVFLCRVLVNPERTLMIGRSVSAELAFRPAEYGGAQKPFFCGKKRYLPVILPGNPGMERQGRKGKIPVHWNSIAYIDRLEIVAHSK